MPTTEEQLGDYARQAAYYDAIYAAQGKDYAAEAAMIHAVIDTHKRTAGHQLLDVACGTGGHLHYLRQWYTVEGLDRDAHMLAVARQRLPDIVFHQGDMTSFDLGQPYDAVTCLFSAIGYATTPDQLRAAVAQMARHLKPGGVLVVEPWFAPQQWQVGTPHATFVDRPDFKLARLSVSERVGEVSVLRFHFLVATPAGVASFSELHELGLFTHAQYLEAVVMADLRPGYYEKGITGRGLYVGVKPS